jgi:CRISPR-associated protein Csd1
MILQALKEYYDRKAADPENGIAPEGFERKELQFLVVIDRNGALIALEDTREKMGKKLVGKTFLVPRSVPRSGGKSYATSFLLWDHFGYLLAHPQDDEKTPKQHKTWIDALSQLPEELKADDGVAAMIKFYASNGVTAVKGASNWKDCAELPSCNMAFRLAGDCVPVPCRPAVQAHVQAASSRDADADSDDHGEPRVVARCLVTGEIGEIARIHGKTPINKDAKTLVGFQKHAGYDSYRKVQGFNAPVSKSAEFAYTTALNSLLKSSTSRMKVGDAVTVFWAAKPCSIESEWLNYFDPPKDNPDRGVKAVESLYASVRNGAFSPDDESNRFFVLGLAPSSVRIAIRFWIADTVSSMARKIWQHFEDIRIVHGPKEHDSIPLHFLLVSTAALGEAEKIPPNLAGDTMRAILEGRPYPQTLLQAAIRRARAEQAEHDGRTGKSLPNVPHERAALIKACLNRSLRFNKTEHMEEMKVSLDLNNTNTGYRLGRLFCVLERIQSEANPGINATIRDRFYGAASSTPVTVFGNLLRLANSHVSKLEKEKPGLAVLRKQLLGEVMNGVRDFPAHLALEEQGRFAIGYYHQMQDFFTRKTTDNNQAEGDEK